MTEVGEQAAERSAATPTRLGRKGRRKGSAGFGAVSLRRLSDPGAPGRIAPFAGAAIIALVLQVVLPTPSDRTMLAGAAVPTTIELAVACSSPGRGCPPGARPSSL